MLCYRGRFLHDYFIIAASNVLGVEFGTVQFVPLQESFDFHSLTKV